MTIDFETIDNKPNDSEILTFHTPSMCFSILEIVYVLMVRLNISFLSYFQYLTKNLESCPLKIYIYASPIYIDMRKKTFK